MKRVINFALLTALAFSMTACGGQRSDTVSGNTEITDGITSEDTTEKEADFASGTECYILFPYPFHHIHRAGKHTWFF